MAGKIIAVLLLGLLVFPFLWGCRSSNDPQGMMGILDMDRLLTESQKARSFQEQLDIRGQEIQREYEDLAKDLDDVSRSQRYQESFQLFLEYKEELEGELNALIEKKLESICRELNIQVVLDKVGVHYGGKDITYRVIEALERE